MTKRGVAALVTTASCATWPACSATGLGLVPGRGGAAIGRRAQLRGWQEPIGCACSARWVRHAAQHGELPAGAQDERFATKAPIIRSRVSLTEERTAMLTSFVVTIIGADRPGIVSLLADRARSFGANWAGSRMASLAGQFAGIVHFEVAAESAEPLAAALRALESQGLAVVIARSEAPPVPPGRRMVKLELVGQDRPGIVRDLSASLAKRGVSIEELHTEIVSAAMSAEHLFKVKALLVVPESLGNDALRSELEALANEMMVDIALGEHTESLATHV